MKQLFLNRGKVLLEEVPTPILGPNEILVALKYSFISSGTESATIGASSKSLLRRFLGDVSSYTKKITDSIKENGVPGTISLIKGKKDQVLSLGYSCSGTVISIGSNVTKVKPGDMVACSGAGIANHAEIISVPENLVAVVSDEHFLKQCSLSTIGTIAMQGLRRADLRLGEKVCVMGLGLIGQITIQLAKLAGCYVVGVDLQDDRLELAKKLGCDKVFNPRRDNIKEELKFFSEHYGVDATIITAGSNSGDIINHAMEVTRRKGKVVLVGDVKLDFDREEFYKKEIDFLISCSYGPGRYDNAYEKQGVDYPYSYVRWTENRNLQFFVELVESKKLDIDSIISKEFSFERAEDAYEVLNKSLGVVLSYSYKNIVRFEDATRTPACIPYLKGPGKLKVSIIGAGGFAKVKLLPILAKINEVELFNIIDVDPANAINTAKQYSVPRTGNRHTEVIGEESDVALIATPHGMHAKQALDCMRSGKAVFLEKPLAINKKELEEIRELVENNNVLLTVDFNRSFAPFNVKIKETIANRTSPLVITYRMNAGYIPVEHWVQSPAHGGRIIGEACHIFDLFCFLTDAQPTMVSVGAIHSKADNLLSTDNFVAHISFSDGSMCSLLYTSIGGNELEKERMEVFCDGKSIIMDDYKKLLGFGVRINEKTSSPDKGHEILLKGFVKSALLGGASPVPFNRIYMASEISLIVDELASTGGGTRIL